MKKNLTLDEKIDTLNLMLSQDGVVMAECVCIAKVFQYCVDSNTGIFDTNNEDIYDVVDSIVTSNAIEENGLQGTIDSMMKLYELALSKRQHDMVLNFVLEMNDRFSNINVDDMTAQLQQGLIELKELEDKH